MTMCPDCGKVYDESDYAGCPFCSGEEDFDWGEEKGCPECDGVMYYDEDEGLWICKNCDYTEEDD